MEQSQNSYSNGAAESEVKTRVITTITGFLLIAAALSLLPGGALRRPLSPLTNRFETIFARPLRLKALGGVYDTTDHYLKPLEIPRPSETISKVLSEIPPGDAIIFITAADDDGSELVYRTVSWRSKSSSEAKEESHPATPTSL